jgi:hypothetical protein
VSHKREPPRRGWAAGAASRIGWRTALAVCAFGIGALVGASASAAPPAAYSATHRSNPDDGNDYSCANAGCHDSPPSLSSGIVPNGSVATSGSNLRTIMTGAGTMSGILSSTTLFDSDLNIIRLYLKDVRDGAVSGTTTFGSSVKNVPGATRDFTITNERGENATFITAPQGSNAEFDVVAGGTCTGATTLAAGGTCTVRMQFTPGGIAGRSGSLIFRINNRVGITSQQVSLTLTGTGLDPTPVYAPINFASLTVPGFLAPTNGSQTMCPTINNNAPTPGGFSLQVALSAAQSGATDYTGYYEITDLASCPGPAVGPRCTSVAAGSSIGGSVSVPAGGSCTLPIKFNPSKFGFGGGTGARNATLTVTHNSPTAGTTAAYNLQGFVAASPRIGITTTPSIVGGRVSPPAFASQIVGTTSVLWNDFTVANSGTANGLDITAVTNSNPTEFTLSENCVAAPPLAMLVGGVPTCTIGLVFKPLAAPAGLGERCTTVTIQAVESSNGDQTVVVCGTGIPVPVPKMDVSRAAIPFGNRSIGAIYLPEPLVITNRATATLALQIGAVAISGSGFAFVPDASSCAGKSLAAGASCTLQVQFTPNPSPPDTVYLANLTLASNDPTTPNLVVPLSATARAFAVPVLQWSAGPPLTFPDLVIAGQEAAVVLTRRLTNTGPGAVDVPAIRLVGPEASNFALSTCPTTLFDSEFCDVTLRFRPGSGGQKTAQIEVVTATGVAPPMLTVQGQGVGGSSPFLTLSSTSLSFGGVRVGARSVPLELRLAAGGDGVLSVTGITADAPFSVASQTCPSMPFALPLGSECSITVTFAPTSTSASSGKLSIATDSGARPVDVSLDGVGQQQADVSGGGCTLASGDPRTDPTLWLLVLAAATVLWRRRTAHRRNGRNR